MWRSLFLLPECQELCRFYVQHGCQIEQEVQRDGAAEVRGFDRAQVLVADADPQGDLTTCLGWRDNDSLTTTITDKLSGVIREDHTDPRSGILHHEEHVDLLPANIELSAMEMMLVTAMSRETILRSYLSKVKDNYDYVLIP